MPNRLLLSALGDSEVSNTVTETSIFSDTVPANTLGTNKLLILRMIGDFLNNSGVAQTFTLRVKYGGTTIETFTSISNASDANRHADLTLVFLGAQNATNSQRSMMAHYQGGAGSATGGTSGGNDHNTSVNQTIAIDSTLDQTLQITVQLSAADANLAFRRRDVFVEYLSPLAGAGSDLLAWVLGDFSVSNTVTETSVFSVLVPAGSVGIGNQLILRVISDVLNNSGAARSLTWRVKFGGTAIFTLATPTWTSSASRRPMPVEVWIGGAGATNAQRCGGMFAASGIEGDAVGPVSGTGPQQQNSTNAATIDTTVAQTLELTVEMSAADFEFRRRVGDVYLVKAA